MNKFTKGSFCFILIFLVLFSVGCESQYLGGDRNTKWKKDLSYLKEALPKKHVNLFFSNSEKRFDNDIDALKNSVDSLNDDEIVDGIYKVVASMGDTHTSVYKKALNIYPMQFYYFKEGIYVVNTTNQYREALYSKLIKVNGIDMDKIKQAILPLIIAENDAMIKKSIPKYLMNAEILHGVKIVPDVKKATFTFQNDKGEVFDLSINSVSSDTFDGKFIINKAYDNSYPLYMQKANLNYWYKYLDSNRTLYFKFNKCQEDNNTERLEVFTNELIKFMNTHTIDKFIIDIRDNSGGSDKYINPFINWLDNNKINNKNNLFVIVGRNTFSSAVLNAVMLKNKTHATFVGEPTSGKPNHYGSVQSFILPNSKISIQYSTQFNKSSEEDSNTFIPDKTIEISIKDYVNKKDPILDYILGI